MQSKWSKIKIGKFAHRFKSHAQVQDAILYKRLTIRMHGKGVVLRDEVKGSAIGTKNQFLAKGGQFLLSRIDARNGAFGILSQELGGALISNSFQAYDLDANLVDIEFFNYFTRTHRFLEFCIAASEGTTNRRNLDNEKFLALEISLPPLDEQKHLVAKIKEIEEKVGGIKKENQLLHSRSSNITKTTAERVFEKIKSVVKLGELTSRITKGESPKWQGFNYQNDGPLFITSENVLWGNIDISEAKHIPPKFHQKLKRSQVNRGDLLVNLVGASIGRAALVREEIGDANINQAVAVITANNIKILPEYILRFLLSPVAQERIQASRVETARPNISLSDLRKLEIPFVGIEEQKRIIKYLSAIEEKQRGLTQEMGKRSALANALMPSVLAKAFSGELLPK